MIRRGATAVTVLAAAFVALCASARAAARAQTPSRPNVVFIMVDDFGYECVAANGGGYETPNVDALAKSGIRFERAFAQPLCTPTRAQLMTGQYNLRNYTQFGELDPRLQCFAQWFRAAGYRTGIFGKWQLGRRPDLPQHFGFDESVLWQHTRRPPRYANPGLEFNGKERDYRAGEFGEDLLTDELCNFVDRNKDRPFLAYYPMVLTHDPFEPTPDSPDYPRSALAPEKDPSRKANPRYFKDMVRYADRCVGRVLAKLDALGLREKTLVVFTGDNGTGRPITSRLSGKPYRGGKGLHQESGMRVPLVVSWPGRIPAGRVTRALVDSTDHAPTLLDAAGLPRPQGWTLDGKSLWPQLTGASTAGREFIYSWYARDGGEKGSEFVRGDRLKLYRGGRLFDVEADPDEQAPLNAATLTPDQIREHRLLEGALKLYEGGRPEWTWKNRPKLPADT